jgi:hypothetical protein
MAFKNTLSELGIEGNFLNLIKKNNYDKIAANIILNGEKLDTFPVKSGTTQECPFSKFFSTSYWLSQLIK